MLPRTRRYIPLELHVATAFDWENLVLLQQRYINDCSCDYVWCQGAFASEDRREGGRGDRRGGGCGDRRGGGCGDRSGRYRDCALFLVVLRVSNIGHCDTGTVVETRFLF